jgi:anthranilate phosphoribosyltransferase
VTSSKPGELVTEFVECLTALLDFRDLTDAQMGGLMRAMIAGECAEAETAALLMAMRMKGESAGEIAAAALVLRERMVPFDSGRDDVLDTCGTGGDGTATFNISTAAALVAAAAGVPVVKHGNRAVSSRSGSADVLTALGVAVDADASVSRRCLKRAGIAFCFAPHFHPALHEVADLRRRLGVRTLFNCLGPLANPAGAPYQLLGVGRLEWLDPLAGALARLGTRHALLVHGCDGLDEVSLTASTLVRQVYRGQVTAHEWTPADFGLAACTLEELRVGGPEESAAAIRAILDGEQGARARIVIANAAAAVLAAERVGSLAEGVAVAAEALATGRARAVLDELMHTSKS